MAEGLMRNLAGAEFDVFSAGTSPRGVHPRSIEVMDEIGIDIRHQTSKSVDTFIGQQFEYVVTVCDRARQNCPIFPGTVPIHWGFDDPDEVEDSQQLPAFRRVRDEIAQRLRLFLTSQRGVRPV